MPSIAEQPLNIVAIIKMTAGIPIFLILSNII
jgi:hypothetical protein